MSTGFEVAIVAASLGSVLTPLPPTPAELGDTMHIEILEAGTAPGDEVAAYLRERLQAAWHQQAEPTPAAGAPRLLTVLLTRAAAGAFELSVMERGELWATRTFESAAHADVVAEKLEAWLFLRSALLRAQSELRPPGPAAIEFALPDGPATPLGRLAAPARPAASGGWSGEPGRSASSSATSDPSGGPSDSRANRPSGSSSHTSKPGSADAETGRVGKSLWLRGVLATIAQTQVGVSARLSVVARRVQAGVELGYLFAPGLQGLRVHHLPLALSLAYAQPEAPRVVAGVVAVLDAKLAVAGHERRAALGVALGPEVQMALGRERATVYAPFLRLSLLWQTVRQRYLLATGDVVDARWVAGVSIGVSLP